MALTEQPNDSVWDISTEKYYFEKMKPHLQEMYDKCVTDEELCRTIQKVINAADSACIRKEYDKLAEAFDTIEVAITDKNYFNGVIKKGTEEEKKLIRDLIGKITDLRTIVKAEPREQAEVTKSKERIGYLSPNGENEDFGSHNMKTLNEPKPKERIPNIG